MGECGCIYGCVTFSLGIIRKRNTRLSESLFCILISFRWLFLHFFQELKNKM